jgi:hypothetical protein
MRRFLNDVGIITYGLIIGVGLLVCWILFMAHYP